MLNPGTSHQVCEIFKRLPRNLNRDTVKLSHLTFWEHGFHFHALRAWSRGHQVFPPVSFLSTFIALPVQIQELITPLTLHASLGLTLRCIHQDRGKIQVSERLCWATWQKLHWGKIGVRLKKDTATHHLSSWTWACFYSARKVSLNLKQAIRDLLPHEILFMKLYIFPHASSIHILLLQKETVNHWPRKVALQWCGEGPFASSKWLSGIRGFGIPKQLPSNSQTQPWTITII